MKVSLQLPTDNVRLLDEFITAAAVAEIAQAAEAAGADAVNCTDHPFPNDEWMATGGHHALDLFVTLAFAAAHTSRLRLHTNLSVIPYRSPGVLAKSVATLDQLSGGRTIIGVGAGYQEREFEALGADFARRNELTDDGIRTIKAIWTGESVDGNTALPRPAQRPHPPVWVGGNSRQAMRRAVDLADGWCPVPNPRSLVARRHTSRLETTEDFVARVDELRAHAASVGRTGEFELPFMPFAGLPREHTAAATDEFIRQAEELARAGATYLVASPRAETRAQFLGEIEHLGRAVIPRLDSIAVSSPLAGL
jgi:probable F420-dependent oxidoreductase